MRNLNKYSSLRHIVFYELTNSIRTYRHRKKTRRTRSYLCVCEIIKKNIALWKSIKQTLLNYIQSILLGTQSHRTYTYNMMYKYRFHLMIHIHIVSSSDMRASFSHSSMGVEWFNANQFDVEPGNASNKSRSFVIAMHESNKIILTKWKLHRLLNGSWKNMAYERMGTKFPI